MTPEVSHAPMPMSWLKAHRRDVDAPMYEGRGVSDFPSSDARGVPRADVLVEGRGVVEHVHRATPRYPTRHVLKADAVHPCDARGVPRADVLIKGRGRHVVVHQPRRKSLEAVPNCCRRRCPGRRRGVHGTSRRRPVLRRSRKGVRRIARSIKGRRARETADRRPGGCPG